MGQDVHNLMKAVTRVQGTGQCICPRKKPRPSFARVEISMETTIVGVSMEMPSFTLTSFQSALGQVVAWWKYLSGDTDCTIAS